MSPKFSTFDTAVKPIDDNDLKFVEVAGLAVLNQELIARAEAVESPQRVVLEGVQEPKNLGRRDARPWTTRNAG